MNINRQTLYSSFVGLALGILMHGSCIFATDPTNIDPKLDSVTPDPTQPDKVLLARGGGGGGGGRGGGSHGGSSRMSSGPHSGAHGISHVGPGRSSGLKRSGGTAGSKKSFSGTRKGSTSGSKVSSKKGTNSKSFAKRGGRGGGGHGGGHHRGGRGRHHGGGHGHHGHHHWNNYWGYGWWCGAWGGWFYPWWGWYCGFGWGPGWGGWYGPWLGFWDFPSYWAWYWPGFALSVFYAGLFAPQPYVTVITQDTSYGAIYKRGEDGYEKVGTGTIIIHPDQERRISIDNRNENVIIITKDPAQLDDFIFKDTLTSKKDTYSVVNPQEAPDQLEEGETANVTDEQVAEFQKTVKDRAQELKDKADKAEEETPAAEKQAQEWEETEGDRVKAES